ncbi:N-acetyltransferase ESCO, acetyl-transferase domain [Cinara cedri]|uniref:N-acetyltransferase ESCO, acetyl-transferase domain n=1 Tax=Cinara cedri TaxID=506608 RepID=A0A5E4MY45_9HEMI|nr:N-acetyltransferase ESCO, acetyl-transferase domain [Cinara cedri]
MASLYSFSASSASSDSENEMRDMQFNINTMDFNKTHFSLKNSSDLSSSCQTSNNSLSYFKKLKRKNEPETRLKNKSIISPYSLLRPLKIDNNLHDSKTKTNYINKKEDFIKKQTEHLNHINLNKEFSTYTMESSSSSADSLNMKHLTQISKIKKIKNSSGSLETHKNKFYTKRKISNINNLNINKENIKPIEFSTSLDSIEFSDVNTHFSSSQNTDLYTNTLKLDDIFLDCSLSGDDLIKNDNYDKNSEKYYPLPNTGSLFIQTKTSNLVSPLKPTQNNISLGIDVDKPLSPPSTDIFNNLSDLNNLMIDDEKNTGFSKPVSPLKPLQMNISFDINDNEPLSQKLTDFNYQSDLNDLMSDESTEDIQNHNADILKPLSFAKPLQMNISSDIDDNEPLSQKSTDFIFQSDLNDLMSDESTEDIQNQNSGILKPLSFAKSLQMNTGFEINNDEILSQKSTDFIFQSNLNDLMSNDKTDEEQNKNVIEIKEQEHIIILNNEHSDINKLKSFSRKVNLNEPKLTSIYNSKSNIENINHEYNNSSLKNKIKNSQIGPKSKNKEFKKQNKSKCFREFDLNEPEPLTSNYFLSNTKSIDSTLKYHQFNKNSKNEIQYTQIDFESQNKASKKPNKSECFHEDYLNESKLSISNYSKSNAESILRIIDSTSKCHQYNNKLQNKIKNTTQIKSEPKKKKCKKSKLLNEPELLTSNYFNSNTESIDSTSNCHQYNSVSKLKIKNIQIDIEPNNNKNIEQNKTKHSHKTTNTTDILPNKKPSSTKIIKKNCSAINTSEDIGLEYDTSKDDYMIELPNGTVIPAFLSTLKPKYGKKLCACGIPTSETPNYWSESFHESLHQNIYKLRFKGNVSDNNTINVKQNNLFYKILILDTEHYNDSDIKKSIKEVNEFVCLEYGIFKTGILSYKNYTYLAVLPNLKVIGYLEVEPIHEAYKINNEQEQPVENKVPAKFGVPKIWVLVKYKNKNVDINLLETFRKKEHLQKEDLAFSLGGCLGVQFIQEYTGNKNILIYKQQ